MNIINKKICLLGEFGVGKTSLIRRFVHDTFSDDYLTTIGVKVTEKLLAPVEKQNKLQQFRFMIWDIAGSEDGKIKHEAYWTGAAGAIIVMDLCRDETISTQSTIIRKFMSLNTHPKIVLAGNKSDLIEPSKLSSLEEQIRSMGDSYGCPALLTSAKTGEHVESCFIRLAEQLMEK